MSGLLRAEEPPRSTTLPPAGVYLCTEVRLALASPFLIPPQLLSAYPATSITCPGIQGVLTMRPGCM
jgi:hypothetical protein